MHNLTEQELKEYTEVFNLADSNKSGDITVDELIELFKLVGLKLGQEDLDAILHDDNVAATDAIDFERFVSIMTKKVNADYTRDQVKNSFKLFVRDKGPEGTISSRDLELALQMYGKHRMLPAEAKTVCSHLDFSDGRFNYADYITRMMNQ